MATYFHGAPEVQPDGLQTLYLMNPSYVGYTDSEAPATNMVLLSSTMNPVNPINHSHAGHHQQHFVGIPLQQAAQPHDRPSPIHTSHAVSAGQGLVPRLCYNLWTPPSSNNSDDIASQFGLRRTSAMPSPQQGLSLSLSPHEMAAPMPEITTPASTNKTNIPASTSLGSGGSNGFSSLQSFLTGSKYVKAAQQLLDEVVNVGKGIKDEPAKGGYSKNRADRSNIELKGAGAAAAEEDTSAKRGADLTTAERQELQMKKTKLINILEEVEQRYRQYHHQMQIVVSSFEAVAGYGSARTYTALALRTISKQFRCLRDAITGQIRATSKSLGEEDAKPGGSGLRFIDHHLRQQRALQQLGMVQQNAWRPQRGLPERSVSILRAWLFEHFLHPYPKDSDKHMLAKQTGLTRSQVSNWFINARVRLWKPMVEEMYLEEIKDHEQNNADENASKRDANGSYTSKSNAQQESSPTATGPTDSLKPSAAVQPSSFVNHDKDAIAPPVIKKARSNDLLHVHAVPHSISFESKPGETSNQELLMKLMDGRQRVGEHAVPHSISFESKPGETSNQELLMKLMDGRQRVGEQGYPLMAGTTSHGGNYGAYPIGELGRFDAEQFAPRFSGNGVSLTLGLQHSENLALSGVPPPFLSGESIWAGGWR